MKTIELKVEGMSCEHCKKTVTNLLVDERGVKEVEVNLVTGLVAITGDEKMNEQQLINAVNYSGIYKAQSK